MDSDLTHDGHRDKVIGEFVTETGDIGGSVPQKIKKGLEEIKIEDELITKMILENVSTDLAKRKVLKDVLIKSREARRSLRR